MLIENSQFIMKKYIGLWSELSANKDKYADERMEVEMSKSGLPTLTMKQNDRRIYFHSKYDPFEEADAVVQKYDDLDEYDHIFIYGLGMGYHVETIKRRFPDKSITIYEPNPAIMYKFLENRLFENIADKKLRNVFIEWDPQLASVYLDRFVSAMNEKVLLVKHPSYERIFEHQTNQFSELFSSAIKGQINNISINLTFEKDWTFNSLKNFPKILATQNVISEKKKYFEHKPAILVAAGPSLQDELENLKKIKANGTAYIFAVGSANKALLRNGIEPDAVTSYDPWTGLDGLDVFSDITDRNITTIPLIYGSSVGHRAVSKFTGPLLHMFINQDTVSPHYLGYDQIHERNSMLSDAPSIAVITLQLFQRLNCHPIILVGQNFAYRGNQYYAQGIQYNVRPTQASEQELSSLVAVQGVEGEEVYTNYGFIRSREVMEAYIRHMGQTNIINTTRGGAKIEGTSFMPLDQVMEQYLKGRVVTSDWYQGDKTSYNFDFVRKQVKLMEKEYKAFETILEKLIQHFRSFDKISNSKIEASERKFSAFDKTFKAYINNKFYQAFIQPMVRTRQQLLIRSMPSIREIRNPNSRAQSVIENFGKYVFESRTVAWQIETEFLELQKYLLELTEPVSV
jgi:hypothetical protein